MEREFIELINKHKGIIHKICRVYFYKNPYIEDYYQEILIRIWKAYPGFRGDSAFSTWMYRVAFNAAIDLVRKQRLMPKYTGLSGKEYLMSDTEATNSPEDSEKLYQAINKLGEMDKAIILLYLEDFSYKEIAAIIGITESYTGVKISRIKNQLIKTIGYGK